MYELREDELRDHYFILAPHPFPIFFRCIKRTVCAHSLSSYPHRRALQDSLQLTDRTSHKITRAERVTETTHSLMIECPLKIVHNLKATCLRVQTSWKGEIANLNSTGSSQLHTAHLGLSCVDLDETLGSDVYPILHEMLPTFLASSLSLCDLFSPYLNVGFQSLARASLISMILTPT